MALAPVMGMQGRPWELQTDQEPSTQSCLRSLKRGQRSTKPLLRFPRMPCVPGLDQHPGGQSCLRWQILLGTGREELILRWSRAIPAPGTGLQRSPRIPRADQHAGRSSKETLEDLWVSAGPALRPLGRGQCQPRSAGLPGVGLFPGLWRRPRALLGPSSGRDRHPRLPPAPGSSPGALSLSVHAPGCVPCPCLCPSSGSFLLQVSGSDPTPCSPCWC